MNTGKFIVCKASAGAGKTFTLVKTFIQLALEVRNENELDSQFKKILAITFTNKAANEMKERILASLKAIGKKGCTDEMGRQIQQDSGLEETTLKLYCQRVHKAILHHYSDLSVCTIDSFMHRVVRTFAHDLDLPMNFDVMIDNSDLIQQSVEALMGLVGTPAEGELTQILCNFAESSMEDNKSYNIESKIAQLAEQLFKEDVPTWLQQVEQMSMEDFSEAYRSLQRDNAAFEQQLAAIGQQARELYTGKGLNVEDFFQGKRGIVSYFKHLEQKEFPAPGQYTMDFATGNKLGGSKISTNTRETLESVAPELQRLFYHAETIRVAGLVDYNSRKMLMKNLYSLALMNKLQVLVKQCSQEGEVVHISEFNKSIANVVNNEPAPFLYERLGSRYKHFLIDEFQDTSRLQWQNLVPLVENGVGSGGTSLVVGDGKQAIYRFRQGDVGQFVRLPMVDNPLHGQILSHPDIAHTLPLQDNQRSGEEIVSFNNDFFAWAAGECFTANHELQQAYIGTDPGKPELEQHPKHKGGYVELGFWEKGEQEQIFRQLADTIHHLVEDCHYHYRDITLLAAKNNQLAQMAAYLSSNEAGCIPLVSSESFLLSGSKVVMMLRTLIDYLIDCNDRLAAAKVVYYLKIIGVVQQDADAYLASENHISLEQMLEEEGIHLDCDHLRKLSLYDLVEEALRELHTEGIESAYCCALLNAIESYSKNRRLSLSEFAEWFDKNLSNLSAKSTGSSDAITLSTIHKAKGLAAPVILYPILDTHVHSKDLWIVADKERFRIPIGIVTPTKDTESRFDPQFDEEKQKTELDQLNVLYVALTRPREKIYIYSELPTNQDGNNYPLLLQHYLQRGQGKAADFRPIECTSGKRFCLGTESESAQREVQREGDQLIERISYNDWADRIVVAESRTEQPGAQQQERIARGLRMHDILSRIHYPEEVEEAVASYCRQERIEQEEQQTLTKEIAALIAQPDWAPYFNRRNRIKTECSLLHHGKILRPDRIVIGEGETWIVDFKTGSEHPSYQAQIEGYCEAVRAMGYPQVRGVLLYVGS